MPEDAPVTTTVESATQVGFKVAPTAHCLHLLLYHVSLTHPARRAIGPTVPRQLDRSAPARRPGCQRRSKTAR